jgi:restriction system protein
MLPLLKMIEDGRPHHQRDVRTTLAQHLNLTEADLAELLPSGTNTLYHDRYSWAKTYLHKAGLISLPSRGLVQINDLGLATVTSGIGRIDRNYLRQFPGFVEFRAAKRVEGSTEQANLVAVVPQAADDSQGLTPDEIFEATYFDLRQEIERQLLDQIRDASPRFFEQLVVDLLVKMGYGGTHEDAGEAIGRTGDGGIDGIIKEDRLGLDAIYVQAKRWTSNTVGRPDVQAFAGSLQGFRAKKGVFITTSQFSSEAHDFVSRIDTKIVLIDGRTLVRFMFDYDLGVSVQKIYAIKRIDGDYFEEA